MKGRKWKVEIEKFTNSMAGSTHHPCTPGLKNLCTVFPQIIHCSWGDCFNILLQKRGWAGEQFLGAIILNSYLEREAII